MAFDHPMRRIYPPRIRWWSQKRFALTAGLFTFCVCGQAVADPGAGCQDPDISLPIGENGGTLEVDSSWLRSADHLPNQDSILLAIRWPELKGVKSSCGDGKLSSEQEYEKSILILMLTAATTTSLQFQYDVSVKKILGPSEAAVSFAGLQHLVKTDHVYRSFPEYSELFYDRAKRPTIFIVCFSPANSTVKIKPHCEAHFDAGLFLIQASFARLHLVEWAAIKDRIQDFIMNSYHHP